MPGQHRALKAQELAAFTQTSREQKPQIHTHRQWSRALRSQLRPEGLYSSSEVLGQVAAWAQVWTGIRCSLPSMEGLAGRHG